MSRSFFVNRLLFSRPARFVRFALFSPLTPTTGVFVRRRSAVLCSLRRESGKLRGNGTASILLTGSPRNPEIESYAVQEDFP
jgi:hypothetical protein